MILDEALIGSYPVIRTLHISCALISITGFVIRSCLRLKHSALLHQRWLRVVPHLNDTVLLLCGLSLAWISGQSPLTSPWLAAKLLALLLYIALGMVVMRFASTRWQQLSALLLAVICFGYMLAVATSRSAWPLG